MSRDKITQLNAVLLLIAASSPSFGAPVAEPYFREPFTLLLHIDKEHGFRMELDKTPIVKDGKIYLLKGDDFGVNLGLKGLSVTKLSHVPKGQKADLDIKFIQEINEDGTAMMLLSIANHTTQTILFDAVMTTPHNNAIHNTTILPVKPGLSGIEVWSHPIIQLVLENVRAQADHP